MPSLWGFSCSPLALYDFGQAISHLWPGAHAGISVCVPLSPRIIQFRLSASLASLAFPLLRGHSGALRARGPGPDRCPPASAPHPLTGVGLQQHLGLPQNPLCPVLGAVCPRQEVFKVGIEFGLLSLAKFLLCELGRKSRRGPGSETVGGCLFLAHPGSWLPCSRVSWDQGCWKPHSIPLRQSMCAPS